MRKVSKNCQDLVDRGLLDAVQARGVILASALFDNLVMGGQTASAEALAQEAGLTIEEVTAGLEHLRSLGFALARANADSYRLAGPFDDLLVPEAVLALPSTCQGPVLRLGVGLPYSYYASCASTSQELKAAASGLPAGSVLVTDDQTEGRGRLGRNWWSKPRKDLTFSMLLRPSLSPGEAPLLSLAAALAVAEVLEGLFGLAGRVRVKWPNDVLIDERKVCGILLESSLDGPRLQWVVVGVGVNANSDPASYLADLGPAEKESWRGRPSPTSLLVETGSVVGRGRLLAELIPRLCTLCADVTASDFIGRLRAKDALLGHRIEVFAGPPDGALLVSGEAVGLGERGELLVRDSQGKSVALVAGEVTLSVDS